MPRSDQGEGAPSLLTWWPPCCLVASEARPRNRRCACETRPETQESVFDDWTMGGIDVIKFVMMQCYKQVYRFTDAS